MRIFCTFKFNERISELQKKNNYANILNDVCDFFKGKNLAELHITRDILQNAAGTFSLNKYRISNSSIGAGKSGSYRCICVCKVKEEKVYIDFIYPKTGADGADNLLASAYKECVKNITAAILEKKLYKLDIEACTLTRIV